MKKVFIILVLGLVIIGGIFYWQWIRSPKYSLWQAKKAIEQHDLISFEKYVDIEGLTGRLIDQLLEFSSSQREEPTNEWTQVGRNLAKGIIGLLKPQLAKMAKEQIAYYVEKGDFGYKKKEEAPEFSIKEIYNKVGAEKSKFQGIEYVKKEGKISLVGLKFYQEQYNSTLILDIKMRDRGGYWQIAELSNFSDVIRKIEELEKKRVEQLNQPIIEAMNQCLILETVRKGLITDSYGFNKKVSFDLRFKNIGQKEIDEYKALVICKVKGGKILATLFISDNENIMPDQTGGGTWTKDMNMFSSSDNELYETAQDQLNIITQIRYIKFTDGSELKLN